MILLEGHKVLKQEASNVKPFFALLKPFFGPFKAVDTFQTA
jgi:hypothetical protein